jgi:phage repressor protein C with HTH and peptisase S24 domain
VDINKIRRENLLKIVNDKYKNLNRFTSELNLGHGNIYNVIKGHRNFGERLARDLEIQIGLEPFALDKSDNELPHIQMATVRQYAINACAGNGNEVFLEDVAEPISIPLEELQERRMKSKDVYVVRVKGSSMIPTFNERDYIFVYEIVENIKNYDVYLVKYDNEIMIKRIENIANTIALKSDNADKLKYPDIVVREDVPFDIMGRIFYKMGSF